MITVLENCRLCGCEFYKKSLKLIDTPLANELYESRDLAKKADRFPLELVMCESCRHVQLRHIVDPKRLFDNYLYDFVDHFEEHERIINEEIMSMGMMPAIEAFQYLLIWNKGIFDYFNIFIESENKKKSGLLKKFIG